MEPEPERDARERLAGPEREHDTAVSEAILEPVDCLQHSGDSMTDDAWI